MIQEEHNKRVAEWLKDEYGSYLTDILQWIVIENLPCRLKGMARSLACPLLVMGAPGNMPRGIMLTDWEMVAEHLGMEG